MDKRVGFTMIETLIVIIFIGILAALAYTHYASVKEDALDKEACQNLQLLRSAERTYKIENGTYYPSSGSQSNIGLINDNFGLSLPTASSRNWDYRVWSTGCSRATRNGGDGRRWYFTINDADDKPNAGSGCP